MSLWKEGRGGIVREIEEIQSIIFEGFDWKLKTLEELLRSKVLGSSSPSPQTLFSFLVKQKNLNLKLNKQKKKKTISTWPNFKFMSLSHSVESPRVHHIFILRGPPYFFRGPPCFIFFYIFVQNHILFYLKLG